MDQAPPSPPLVTRPCWDDYFLVIAQAVSRRGDCTRRQVGAVLVRAGPHAGRWRLQRGS